MDNNNLNAMIEKLYDRARLEASESTKRFHTIWDELTTDQIDTLNSLLSRIASTENSKAVANYWVGYTNSKLLQLGVPLWDSQVDVGDIETLLGNDNDAEQ